MISLGLRRKKIKEFKCRTRVFTKLHIKDLCTMTQIFIFKIPVILEIRQVKYSGWPHFCLLETKMGLKRYVRIRGTHPISEKNHWNTLACSFPNVILCLILYLKPRQSMKQAILLDHTRSKVTRRNDSSGEYHLGMFRLVRVVNGYDFRFEIQNSTQNDVPGARTYRLGPS